GCQGHLWQLQLGGQQGWNHRSQTIERGHPGNDQVNWAVLFDAPNRRRDCSCGSKYIGSHQSRVGYPDPGVYPKLKRLTDCAIGNVRPNRQCDYFMRFALVSTEGLNNLQGRLNSILI